MTDSAFFGFVRKRSSGDRRSGTSGFMSRGASMEGVPCLSRRLSGLSTMRFGVS